MIDKETMDAVCSDCALYSKMMMHQAGGQPIDHLTMVTAIFLKAACAFAVLRNWDEARTLKRAQEMVRDHLPTAYKEVKADYENLMKQQTGEAKH
jgi:hypothetical protein